METARWTVGPFDRLIPVFFVVVVVCFVLFCWFCLFVFGYVSVRVIVRAAISLKRKKTTCQTEKVTPLLWTPRPTVALLLETRWSVYGLFRAFRFNQETKLRLKLP